MPNRKIENRKEVHIQKAKQCVERAVSELSSAGSLSVRLQEMSVRLQGNTGNLPFDFATLSGRLVSLGTSLTDIGRKLEMEDRILEELEALSNFLKYSQGNSR